MRVLSHMYICKQSFGISLCCQLSIHVCVRACACSCWLHNLRCGMCVCVKKEWIWHKTSHKTFLLPKATLLVPHFFFFGEGTFSLSCTFLTCACTHTRACTWECFCVCVLVFVGVFCVCVFLCARVCVIVCVCQDNDGQSYNCACNLSQSTPCGTKNSGCVCVCACVWNRVCVHADAYVKKIVCMRVYSVCVCM